MKKIAIIFITSLIFFNGYAQVKRTNELKAKSSVINKKKEIVPPPPSPNDFIRIKPHKINFTKYNLSKRLSFYPFNKTTKIMVVSFSTKFSRKESYVATIDSVFSDSLHIKKEKIENIKPFKIPMKNEKILFDKMDQIKILTLSEEIEISDILYNSCYRWSDWEDKVLGCYFPRNAIIFFDENDKPFEYLEICFECRAIEKSSKNIKLIENCNYLYEELEKYFNKLGIITKPKIEE